MKNNINDIYMDVIDRIYLNNLSGKNSKAKTEQIKKDIELKLQLEKVINNPSCYDIYYKKSTLELTIELIDINYKKNYFDRIDIRY